MYVRPARKEDATLFAEWFLLLPSFRSDVVDLPETYTLCAYKPGKIIGFMVIQYCLGIQVLSRFISNPEATDLEKAAASSLLVKQVIALGYMNNRFDIFFMGDNAGTNKIASRVFSKVEYKDYAHVFEKTEYPVYKLHIKDLEWE